MAANTVRIGRGSKVYVGLQDADASLAFVPTTITAGGAAAANATAITVGALASGVKISKFTFLNFITTATGARKMAQLSSQANATATTLSVYALSADDAISSGDVAYWPPIVGARTSANVAGQGNRVTSFTFEDDGYETGFNASISNQCNLMGNFAPRDAGFEFLRYSFQKGIEVRLRIEFPKETVNSSVVKIVEGRYTVSNAPLEIPANGIITANIEGSFNGQISETYGAPLAYA